MLSFGTKASAKLSSTYQNYSSLRAKPDRPQWLQSMMLHCHCAWNSNISMDWKFHTNREIRDDLLLQSAFNWEKRLKTFMGKFIASDPEYSHYVASLFLSLILTSWLATSMIKCSSNSKNKYGNMHWPMIGKQHDDGNCAVSILTGDITSVWIFPWFDACKKREHRLNDR